MQKELGQFYTDKNIFDNPAFLKWWGLIPEEKKQHVLEPFAGKNGIIRMLEKLKLVQSYSSFDIHPRHESVQYQDTLEHFPEGFNTVVTNPPFLARNSATRRNFDLSLSEYNDLYEVSLDLCLKHCEYVAAIIPESFLTTNLFKERLHTVISLEQRHIFKDTEHPVCLALFVATPQMDYHIYKNKKYIGTFQELKSRHEDFLSEKLCQYKFIWNHPEGQIGLKVIDATDESKPISFLHGTEIDGEDINPNARLRTRFLVLNEKDRPIKKLETEKLIRLLNRDLKKYRELTHDVFLTAFKGMRSDKKYRRRLDFTTARRIVSVSLAKL